MSGVSEIRTTVRCADCNAETSDRTRQSVCERCGGLLQIDRTGLPDGATLRDLFDRRASMAYRTQDAHTRSGVWRFRELVLNASDDEIVSHPEGNTPLLEREAVSQFAGVDALLLKHEGHNPTGSFKDRGMTAAVTQALRIRATAVACASTGNTSASLSAYASQAGIPSFVFVPDGQVAGGKLAQTIAYGARTLRIIGDFDDCLALARRASEELGVYLVNSVNPFRIEGQKTTVLELLQQLAWDSPDWIALPAGNLGNTSAFGKALTEAHGSGLIDRMPRLLSVQAEGAAPFAQAFAKQFVERIKVRAETRATAIRIGDPASWDRAVHAIHATNGIVEQVSDEEIFTAKNVVDRSGIGCEPASAASVAGVRKLVARGVIGRSDRVVCVLTGHLLKDSTASAPSSQDDGALSVDAALALIGQSVSR